MNPEVIGRGRLPHTILRRKLGRTAYDLWQHMCFVRNKDGELSRTVQDLRQTPFKIYSTSAVKRALIRLRDAGLVVSLRKRSGKTAIRVCYGDPSARPAWVPRRTWRWAQLSDQRGGKRNLDGRNQYPLRTDPPAEPLGNRGQTGPPDTSKHPPSAQPKSLGKEVKPGHQSENSGGEVYPGHQDPRSIRATRTEKPNDSATLVGLSGPRPSTINKLTSLHPSLEEKGSSRRARRACAIDKYLGTTFPDKISAPGLGAGLVDSHPDVPAWPHQVLKERPRPGPPLLPVKDLHPDYVAEHMSRLTRSVAAQWWPEGFRLRRHPKGSSRKILLEAAAALDEHRTQPAYWAAWTADFYRDQRSTTRPPPLGVFWDPARIHAKSGWCRKEMQGRPEFARAVPNTHSRRVLLQRHAGMVRQLQRLGLKAANDDEVRGVVARWFPDDVFKRMVDAANREVAAEILNLEGRARHGEYIWVVL